MIVCVCHYISDSAVRAKVRAGVCSVDALAAELGVGTSCGCCRECVREVVEDELAASCAGNAWANSGHAMPHQVQAITLHRRAPQAA